MGRVVLTQEVHDLAVVVRRDARDQSARAQSLGVDDPERATQVVFRAELAFDLDRIAGLQGEACLELQPLLCQIEEVTVGGLPIQCHQPAPVDGNAEVQTSI